MENIWIYDCEVFAHDWIVVAKRPDESGDQVIFHNDNYALAQWIDSLQDPIFGGYNTKHYDQWVLKAIYHGAEPELVKELSDYILTGNPGWEFDFIKDKFAPWINFDLMDDIPVPLRLKEIEGNLGMEIEESSVSFNLDRPLTEAELQEVIRYCCHDVEATIRLFHERKSYLKSKIAVGTMCGLSVGKSLRLTNAKLTAEFLGAEQPPWDWDDKDIYEFPDNLIITKYPDVIEFFCDIDPERKRKLEIEIAGVPHTVAWGGLHGARECYQEERTETRRISSRDVTSYYPSLMINNGYMSRNVPDPDEYKPLEVGDVFGGVLQLKCGGSAPVNEGDEVLALFRRGTQTSATCPEYRACSADRCGDPADAYTTTIDPNCAAAQANNPSLDCPPIETVDEAAVLAYDECDAACLEETRETCLSHASDEQLGGVVLVAKWDEDRVWFYWAGEERSEPWSTLQSSECHAHMQDLWQNYYSALPKTPSSEEDVAPPPDFVDEGNSVVCPAP